MLIELSDALIKYPVRKGIEQVISEDEFKAQGLEDTGENFGESRIYRGGNFVYLVKTRYDGEKREYVMGIKSFSLKQKIKKLKIILFL